MTCATSSKRTSIARQLHRIRQLFTDWESLFPGLQFLHGPAALAAFAWRAQESNRHGNFLRANPEGSRG